MVEEENGKQERKIYRIEKYEKKMKKVLDEEMAKRKKKVKEYSKVKQIWWNKACKKQKEKVRRKLRLKEEKMKKIIGGKGGNTRNHEKKGKEEKNGRKH